MGAAPVQIVTEPVEPEDAYSAAQEDLVTLHQMQKLQSKNSLLWEKNRYAKNIMVIVTLHIFRHLPILMLLFPISDPCFQKLFLIRR